MAFFLCYHLGFQCFKYILLLWKKTNNLDTSKGGNYVINNNHLFDDTLCIHCIGRYHHSNKRTWSDTISSSDNAVYHTSIDGNGDSIITDDAAWESGIVNKEG